MPLTPSIPRFLLPQRGAIWQSRLSTPISRSVAIRHASHKSQKKPTKPLVLEKPTKFNPPSHGARIRKDAPRYPGPQLSAEEQAARKAKQYPHMMPPEGTFKHWFIHNKAIHVWITLGTLFSLAITVWITNFKRNSPFADMLPSFGEFVFHPIAGSRTFFEVLKLNSAHMTAETMERRKRKVEDVSKRAAYRKAHGLDKDEGFGGWTAKTDEQILGPGIPVGDHQEAIQGTEAEVPLKRETKAPKRWLGIW